MELNKILNNWDFLLVVPEGISTEYEDLIDPILNFLSKDKNDITFEKFVEELLTKSYGIKISSTNKEVKVFSANVIKWWKNRKD